ncbi:histidine phosphatase family protein [Shigella flexneri]
MQVATCAKELGITHIISSDLGRTRRTAESSPRPAADIIFDSRLRLINMGVPGRHIDSLPKKKRTGVGSGQWHSLTHPEGQSMQELSDRVNAALESRPGLTAGSRPLLVSQALHGRLVRPPPDYQHGQSAAYAA